MYDGRGGQERTASPIRSSWCQSAAFNTLSCNVCDAAAEVGHLLVGAGGGRDQGRQARRRIATGSRSTQRARPPCLHP